MILLDTHVVIWLALTPEKLSSAAAEAIRRAVSTGRPAISVVTLYEIANSMRRNRIKTVILPSLFLDRIARRFTVLPVSDVVAIRAAQLPERMHGDPMDRMIAATAIVENCTLITADQRIAAAGVCKTLW